MVNPFDLRTALVAKPAQHAVLIHFPIALFITAVLFDFIAQWTRRRGLAYAAYYNLLFAAISTVPVVATGILAGQKLKGILLLRPGACGRFERPDLAGLMVTFPRKADGKSLT